MVECAKKQTIITSAFLGIGFILCLGLTFWLSQQAQESLVTVSFLACDGQDADAILIRSGQSFAMIDTGEDTCEKETLAYLRSQGVVTLDFIILSHPDKDHIGNVVAILEQYPTATIYVADVEKGSSQEVEMINYVAMHDDIDYQVVTAPLTTNLDEAEFEIIPSTVSFVEPNDMSLLTYMIVGGISFFFTGDIEKERITEVLEQNPKTATILKLPHHGRYSANLDDLISVIQPELAIVSATALDEKTARVLNDLNLEYAITTKNIIISTDGKEWKLR